MSRNPVHTIDKQAARKLRAKGLRWKQVGIELAKQQGRDTPFKPEAVHHAVSTLYRRKR